MRRTKYKMTEGFKFNTRGKIAQVILNRPDKKNALLPDFWKEFPRKIKSISDEGSYRAIILSGEGADFCAGMDLSVFAANPKLNTDSTYQRERIFHLIALIQDAISTLERCRVPVIAAIQGRCLGAGLDIVSACDLRFSTDTASFRIEETNVGIMADLGSLQRLTKLMPEAVVKEMAFSGETLSAQRAYEIGFVNKTYSDAETLEKGVFETAERIAAMAPLVISSSKRCINYARDHSTADSLEQGALLQSAIFDLADVQRFMMSRAGKCDAPADLPELDQEL